MGILLSTTALLVWKQSKPLVFMVAHNLNSKAGHHSKLTMRTGTYMKYHWQCRQVIQSAACSNHYYRKGIRSAVVEWQCHDTGFA